ncbi:hypothetical protein C8Q76DRAFT_594344, partial [Earliella scabrosa]
KASGGDGANFTKAVFTAAAVKLASRRYKGAEKSWESCKNKWGKLRNAYWAVVELKKASGFSYDDEHGAGITRECEDVWKEFIQ